MSTHELINDSLYFIKEFLFKGNPGSYLFVIIKVVFPLREKCDSKNFLLKSSSD